MARGLLKFIIFISKVRKPWMASYKKVKQLIPTDASYIAGLIDGEGTISLTRRHRNERRQLEISISNTDISLLEFIHAKIGAGRITRKRIYKSHHTPSATYLISNRQALELLQQTSKYLRTYKKERAELVLTDYVCCTPQNGKYNIDLLKQRKDFESRFMNILP
jgi:hypothetical protein